MGYEQDSQGWHHSDRQAIFVGDFFDRGPEQVQTYRLVRSMIDNGAALAVMGNHEFNAVAYKTSKLDQAGEYLRPHTDKNRKQHAAFLNQVVEDSPLHEEIIVWCRRLPLYLDLKGLRVIHACWHKAALKTIAPFLDAQQCLRDGAWLKAATKGSDVYHAAETVLKGLEIPLPPGESFLDNDGNERDHIRTRWWERGHNTYRSVAMLDNKTRQTLSNQPLPAQVLPGYIDDKPVFFGHYWLRGTPEPISDRVACLDYTVTEPPPAGKLVAYRWAGETSLKSDGFIWV
jgi:hypothetical protein